MCENTLKIDPGNDRICCFEPKRIYDASCFVGDFIPVPLDCILNIVIKCTYQKNAANCTAKQQPFPRIVVGWKDHHMFCILKQSARVDFTKHASVIGRNKFFE